MKTAQTLFHQLPDRSRIMDAVAEALSKMDTQFFREEKAYREAIAAFEQEYGRLCSLPLTDYLTARETQYVSAVLYMGWQGMQLNMEIFRDPVYIRRLHGDLEGLYQEEKLPALQGYGQMQEIISAFHKAAKGLPRGAEALLSDICGYYAYLETVGYKLAHYYGYRMADSLLYHILPGYTENRSNTEYYRRKLSEYLGFPLV